MPEPSDQDPLPGEAERDAGGSAGRPAQPADASPSERAERALDALRLRLANAPPADPVARALRRVQRRERAATAPFTAGARPVRSDLQPQDIPLALEYEEGRDPREDQEWFRSLPPKEQDRLRREWLRKRELLTPVPQRWGRRLLRGAGTGVAVFLLAGLLQAPLLGFGAVPAMLAAGAVAGALTQFTQRGRFQGSLVSAATYLAFIVVPMVVRDGSMAGVIGSVLPVLGGLVIVTWAGGLIGLEREMQQSGGFTRD
jgi:hypothetical protein